MKRGAILLAGLLWASPGPAVAEDVLVEARALVKSGQRAASLELLERRLAESPGDTDARVYYGTVLSWEGRYDEARRELGQVLSGRPRHGDALPALINLELWSDHPARAEQLASEGLEQKPNDTGLLLARARALRNLGRDKEAVDVLDQLLDLAPGDPQARSMWRSLKAKGRLWELKTGYEESWFSDGRSHWHEGQIALKRRTRLGSLIGRYTYANRFEEGDSLVELDFYPGLGRGTYAFLSAGYAPKGNLFPDYRLAADVYRSLGGGFEASLGYRRLGFSSAVDIYTGSFGKYLGNWYFLARTYYKPDALGASNSFHFSVRRFLSGDGKRYVNLRYGHGFFKDEARSLNEIAALDSDTVAGEVYYLMTDTLGFQVNGSWSREERVERSDLSQYSASAGLFVRF